MKRHCSKAAYARIFNNSRNVTVHMQSMRDSFAITTNPSASPLLQLTRMPVIEGLKPATSHLTQTTPCSQRQYVIPRSVVVARWFIRCNKCCIAAQAAGDSKPPDSRQNNHVLFIHQFVQCCFLFVLQY